MQLSDRVRAMREEALARGDAPVPAELQGVTKQRIGAVLRALDLETADRVDAVFALLDDRRPSWFAGIADRTTFAEGASIAHLACHVGILQRGGSKLDREGRDYWIKPLREIGAVEAIYLEPRAKSFVAGHPVPKSPHSAYRLDPDCALVLRAAEGVWQALLDDWIDQDRLRGHLRLRAAQAEDARCSTLPEHRELIRACCEVYAPRFLPGYEVLFVDDADGDRVSDAESNALARAGLRLDLGDAMPDVLLWHPRRDVLWVIEAVTSDGEVDRHKVELLQGFATRHGKSAIGFTTAYPTWKLAAQRQGRHKNIATGTYIWIREDPAKQFLAEAFEV